MDTSAVNIEFDDQKICNFCTNYFSKNRNLADRTLVERDHVPKLIEEIKREGRDKPYDCVVGVSGGVDSSYVLVKAVEFGLRPLAVHMDNGWNSELAQNNIANLVKTLGLDLHTHVIEWDEYRSLMLAFLRADVVDVELLYDNAMFGVNFRQASKFGLRTIIGGSNQATEGLEMPIGWNWHKLDLRNIRDIGREGGVRIKTFPGIGTYRYLWCRQIKRIRWLSLLDHIDYHKETALRLLEENYGYKRYPYKHYESVFTRFYQAVILPEKFGIDKRLLHFSSLIVSDQMEREEALRLLEQGTYTSEADRENDRQYVLKKLGWTEQDLFEYLRRPGRDHSVYRSELDLWNRLMRIRSVLQR